MAQALFFLKFAGEQPPLNTGSHEVGQCGKETEIVFALLHPTFGGQVGIGIEHTDHFVFVPKRHGHGAANAFIENALFCAKPLVCLGIGRLQGNFFFENFLANALADPTAVEGEVAGPFGFAGGRVQQLQLAIAFHIHQQGQALNVGEIAKHHFLHLGEDGVAAGGGGEAFGDFYEVAQAGNGAIALIKTVAAAFAGAEPLFFEVAGIA